MLHHVSVSQHGGGDGDDPFLVSLVGVRDEDQFGLAPAFREVFGLAFPEMNQGFFGEQVL